MTSRIETQGLLHGPWMKPILKHLATASLVGLVLLRPFHARADEDDDGDHDRARDLYERGEIKGLANILGVVHADAPGDIVAVDFIRIGLALAVAASLLAFAVRSVWLTFAS